MGHISGVLVSRSKVSAVGDGPPFPWMGYDNAVAWITADEERNDPEGTALYRRQAVEAQQFIQLCGQYRSVVRDASEKHVDDELASSQPERSYAGGAVTWELLEMMGTKLHSNVFNPIKAAGVQQLETQLKACGSGIQFSGADAGSAGPWGVAEISEPMICGGWDQQTLQTATECVWSVARPDEATPLSVFGLWMERAATSDDSTLWVAIF